MLTRRGRRLFQVWVACIGWLLGIVLVMVSGFWEVIPVRLLGFIILFGSATWTGCLAVSRQTDVIRAAYELGRATGAEAGGVTPLR